MAEKRASKSDAQPQKVDLLLSGCDVVTIDGKNSVIRDGAVAIKGNRIVWIGKASRIEPGRARDRRARLRWSSTRSEPARECGAGA